MSTTNIYFNEQVIASDGQSVLTALLKRGHAIPYSCQSGVCHACLMVCDKGTLPAAATAGLNAEQTRQGLFLSCSCIPSEDLWVSRYDLDAIKIPARVIDKRMLNTQVMALTLKAQVSFRAGQFMTLWRDDAIGRCYSLAAPQNPEDHLQFHLKILPNGAFSHWAQHRLQVGDRLNLQGPEGESYYRAEHSEQPMLLAGIGTGLAPLYGIVSDALTTGHRGPIHLVVGAKDSQSFYFMAELQALSRRSSIHLHCITQSETQPHQPDGITSGDIYTRIRQQFPSLRGYHIHLAGTESFIQKMRKVCFMAGANPRQVFTDSFG